jgi:hypothetical protein
VSGLICASVDKTYDDEISIGVFQVLLNSLSEIDITRFLQLYNQCMVHRFLDLRCSGSYAFGNGHTVWEKSAMSYIGLLCSLICWLSNLRQLVSCVGDAKTLSLGQEPGCCYVILAKKADGFEIRRMDHCLLASLDRG